METNLYLTRIDLEKCKTCSCGSGEPAKYFCTKVPVCKDQHYYCESCQQSDETNGHDHKGFLLTTIGDRMNKECANAKTLAEELCYNATKNYDNVKPYIKYLDEGMKYQQSIETAQPQELVLLEDKISHIKAFKEDITDFQEQVEQHFIDYEIVEMGTLIANRLPAFVDTYNKLNKFKNIDQDLFWELYKPVFMSDYQGTEHMAKFSQDNFNMLFMMRFRS